MQAVKGEQPRPARWPIRRAVALIEAQARPLFLELFHPQDARQSRCQGVAKGEFDEVALVGCLPDRREEGLPRQPLIQRDDEVGDAEDAVAPAIEGDVAPHQPPSGDEVRLAGGERIVRVREVAGRERSVTRVNEAGPPAQSAAGNVERLDQADLRLHLLRLDDGPRTGERVSAPVQVQPQPPARPHFRRLAVRPDQMDRAEEGGDAPVRVKLRLVPGQQIPLVADHDVAPADDGPRRRFLGGVRAVINVGRVRRAVFQPRQRRLARRGQQRPAPRRDRPAPRRSGSRLRRRDRRRGGRGRRQGGRQSGRRGRAGSGGNGDGDGGRLRPPPARGREEQAAGEKGLPGEAHDAVL